MNHSEFNFSLQSKKSDIDVQDCNTNQNTVPVSLTYTQHAEPAFSIDKGAWAE